MTRSDPDIKAHPAVERLSLQAGDHILVSVWPDEHLTNWFVTRVRLIGLKEVVAERAVQGALETIPIVRIRAAGTIEQLAKVQSTILTRFATELRDIVEAENALRSAQAVVRRKIDRYLADTPRVREAVR